MTTATVRGKSDLFLAHSVLDAFGIPTLVVWDNNSGVDQRAIATRTQKLRSTGEMRELTEVDVSSSRATM
ncbi:hypothetical protein C5B85_14960 [Pseudoclavibacter sp. AY1F1]|nr:hypothetical protein C5B85_14960 [Pseudoclavibacter sp. AY1F1]